METRETVRRLLEQTSASELGWAKSSAQARLRDVRGAAEALTAIATDPGQPRELRFKAYEALFAGGGELESTAARREAAAVYTATLAAAEGHDDWGLPEQTPSGPGAHLVALGREALPSLLPLLEDDDRPLLYEGSEEPTISELRGYRVCDLAGRYVSVILGVPFAVTEDDPARRDEDLHGIARKAYEAVTREAVE